uniref:Ribosomal protein S8 n=1 Tax=Physarum polycephalum TaxID=5791 RepID=F2Y9V5_PHYPO|nr:ribosomal protein S8 [Physarum polycephalum]
MTARFSAMISIMNATIKTGNSFCEIPANNLCINTLRLLRNQGYIWGFSYVSPQLRAKRLYPRVKIFFKYIDSNTPVIKSINIFKRTRSNFRIIRNNKLYQILAQNKLYILSTTKGLIITSLDNLYNDLIKSQKNRLSGKLLAEIFI